MKKLDTFAGPGEIKRREVNWTLTKKLEAFADPGEIKRREVVLDSHEEVRLSFAGPGEIKRREVVLDPQESPEEIKKSREVELGPESWTSFASVNVSRRRSYRHCFYDFVPHSSWDSNCTVVR